MNKESIFSTPGKASLFFVILMVSVVFALSFTQNADACSVMMKTNKQGVFVGRSSDFFLPLKTRLEVIPAGYKD